jgi:outer membrane biosynthesis protein TonB
MEVEAVTDMFAVYAQENPQIETPDTDHTSLATTYVTETSIDDNINNLKLSDQEKNTKKALLQKEKDEKKALLQKEKDEKKALLQKEKDEKKALLQKEKDEKKAQLEKEKELKQKKQKKTKDTNATDTNNATDTSDTLQQVTTAIIHANTNNNNTKIVKVDGITYTIHLLNNHVYDHNNTHVGTFDPKDKSIEFHQDQEQEQEDNIDINL